MDIESKLRLLAKSSYWQNYFNASKDCSGIHLFKNKENLSGLQVRFLYWLNVYNMLFEELMKYEDEYLSEKVILDDDRCDAYLIYRNKKHDFQWRKYREEEKLSKAKNRHSKKHKNGDTNLIQIDFKQDK